VNELSELKQSSVIADPG